MFRITFHIAHQYTTFYIPPLATSRITPLPRIAPCHSPDTTSFHIAQRSIPQHTHCLTPHHTTFHIPCHSQPSTSFYITQRSTFQPTHYIIPHRTTFHIPSHSPHSASFHIAQRSTFHATAHTPIHITAPLSITPLQFERLELCMIRFDMFGFHSHTTFYTTCPHTQHKNVEKVQLSS